MAIKGTSWTTSRLRLMKPSGLTKRSVRVPRTAAHMPIVAEQAVAWSGHPIAIAMPSGRSTRISRRTRSTMASGFNARGF